MSQINSDPLVILVDDDYALCDAIAQGLALAGLKVEAFHDARKALARLNSSLCVAIVADIRLPGMDGFEFVQSVRSLDPDIPAIFMTGHGDISIAIAAMKDGAFDFFTKPFAMSELVDTVHKALARRAATVEERWLKQLAENTGDHPLAGHSAASHNLRELVDRIADAGLDTIIVGETGVGKELVARLLHRRGQRRKRNLVTINCASLNESNVSDLLYGTATVPGKLELAQGGVLVLDELDSMPLPVQAHCLRLLEERTLLRRGARDPEALDVQFVSCTKTDLEAAARSGGFRADLFYRLAGAIIEIPPLRSRRDDVMPIFAMFCGLAADDFGKSIPPLTAEERTYLLTHGWPGNAHELRHFAFRHVLGITRHVSHGDDLAIGDRVAQFEKALIEQLLLESKGDVAAAAICGRLPKKTLYDKIARHEIDLTQYRPSPE